MKTPRLLFLLPVFFITHLSAAPRDSEWKLVADAVHKDQPKTAINLLKPIETAACADKSWGEAAKALAQRMVLEGKTGGGPQVAIKKLDAEIVTVPVEARPILLALQARWLFTYYQHNRWRFAHRSATTAPPSDDFETWDLARILTEVDKRLQQALADKTVLQAIPVSRFRELLDGGELGDSFRPTLYDFIVFAALDFHTMEEVAVSKPQDSFEFAADSAALGTPDEFLAWNPQPTDMDSPKLRALHLFQDLLNFHKSDQDPSAYLHCDLERIRWAGHAATGPHKPERLDAALRAFIETNAKHPLSADARQDVARALEGNGKTKEAHDFAKTGAGAFPDHPFGKVLRDHVDLLEAKSLDLHSATHWTPAGEEVTVEHHNISHVWFRAYRRPWNPSLANLVRDTMPWGNKQLAALLKESPARAWDAPLRDDKDFHPHTEILPAPADLPPGYYVVVASGEDTFSLHRNGLSVIPVHVTTYALVSRQDRDKIGGYVTDAVTGSPLAGIAVEEWHEHKERAVHRGATTNQAGWFAFTSKDLSQNGYAVVAGSGDNRAVAYAPGMTYEQPAPGKAPVEMLIFTDRAIYRPGQTVHFKGICYKADPHRASYMTIAGHPATVRFTDPYRKEIAKVEVLSNDRGSFAGIFTAPSNRVLGNYFVEGTTIHVEEYKRPKFFAEIKPPLAATTLGSKVEVIGKAEAYTGAAVDGAKVAWRVERQISWPSWIGCCKWLFSMPFSHAEEIAYGTATTSADGTFPIAFLAEPDRAVNPQAEPTFHYQVTADVTDPSGETRSAACFVSVGYTTLRASITSDKWLEQEKPVVLKVRTESHDGEGRRAEGVLSIYKLKEPEICPRGGRDDSYHSQRDEATVRSDDSPDPDNWKLGELVKELPVQTGAAKSDKAGTADLSVTLPAGIYRAVFVTKDSTGRQVQALLGMQVIHPAADRFPTKLPFFTAAPTLQAEPGKPFILLWGSGHPAARARVDWFRDGVLLKSEWSAPDHTQQVFTFTPAESLRGGFRVRVSQTTMCRLNEVLQEIDVPWSNKDLKLRWEHFTSKLDPGAKETWSAIVTGPDGQAANTEMVATLYDSSLDSMTPHIFPNFSRCFPVDQTCPAAQSFSSQTAHFREFAIWRELEFFRMFRPYLAFRGDLEFYGRGFGSSGGYGGVSLGGRGRHSVSTYPDEDMLARSLDMRADMAAGGGADIIAGMPVKMPGSSAAPGIFALTGVFSGQGGSDGVGDHNTIDDILNNPNRTHAVGYPDASKVSPRQNLQETAFFFPQLTSDEKGEIRMSFTMPEALTKWKFLGFAHDSAMRSGTLEGETVTAKDLMVQPNPPRFLREGDIIDFTVKISNQSDKEQSGKARLTLSDAATRKDTTAALGITASEQSWKIPAKESRTFTWHISVPDGAGFLTYKAVATTGALSDGEEGWLPVIPRRILVTESMSLPIRNAGTKDFTFQKLKDSGNSPTMENRFVHMQVVSQPAWYAVMALPYLMEYPHECAEQTFNRYYANALARQVANSNPKIRNIFDLWKNTPALDSPLTKNADLKGILLEETPWLAEANQESQARRNVGLLFDDNTLGTQLERTKEKLAGMQRPDGLWPWFPGGPGSEYISLYITTGFARLRALGVETDITPALKSLPKLDRALTECLDEIKKEAVKHPEILKQNHLEPWIAHHLYTRTFFLKDKAISRNDKEAFDYFTNQAKQYWTSLDSRMSRAHAALALLRVGQKDTAKLITRSLKENAVVSEEMGMSWKDSEAGGWYWWQAPIETQAMMIEAFREIDHDDKAVDDCQTWLIKQKQVQDWKTSKATADAVYSLLLGGKNLLGSNELLQISLGGNKVEPEHVEPGTGFYENRITGADVKPAMGDIKLTKTDPGVAWASVHWQYLEDMAKVTAHNATPLTLEKSLFVRHNTAKGPQLDPVTGPVKVGDELVTRLVLRNDRAMEFIHLKDLRGSGTEPVNVLSGYRWQDGFGYYEVTRDTASHFFIDALPAGTHVFETSVRVQHAGTYQTGIAEIRCMYAPEFNAHSASLKIEAVKD